MEQCLFRNTLEGIGTPFAECFISRDMKKMCAKSWLALNCHIHNNPYLVADKRAALIWSIWDILNFSARNDLDFEEEKFNRSTEKILLVSTLI